MSPSARLFRRKGLRPAIAAAATAVLASAFLAEVKAGKAELKREMALEMSESKASKRDAKPAAKRGAVNSAEMQARNLSRLRERLEVSDDEEWAVIAERIQKVTEARAALGNSANGHRGDPFSGGAAKRPAGANSSGHPEQDALRSAVRDQLPDAEIQVRLARAHEIFEKNQARLVRAQSELRAVLTLRQEASAVVLGLLPP